LGKNEKKAGINEEVWGPTKGTLNIWNGSDELPKAKSKKRARTAKMGEKQKKILTPTGQNQLYTSKTERNEEGLPKESSLS